MNVNIKWMVLGAALGFMGSFGVACGPVNRCTPQSCQLGCCDANGVCQSGASDLACGSGGSSCSACAFGQNCQLGVCRLSSGGMGGGGGTGGGGGSATRGDIIFTWDLNGRTCLQSPEVVQVFVQIPGQTLQNGGAYGCNNGGTDGIRLLNFAPGVYSFTISAQNQAGAVVYEASGALTVDGNVARHVSLLPRQSVPSETYVRAIFPPNATQPCVLAPFVDVTIDSGPTSTVNCSQLASTNGLVINSLAPGRHTIDLSARDSTGLYYFRAINSFDVVAGSSAYDFTLEWIVGSLPIKWTFSNGVTQLTCAQAGVSQVQVTLRDSQNADSTFTVPCERSLGVQGTQVPYVYYGNYQLFLSSAGTAGVVYRSNLVSPPVATVIEGQFPDVDNPTLTPAILMTP